MNKTLVDKKIGRNDPCICGSGQKFKKCCIDKIEIKRPTILGQWSIGQDAHSEKIQECIEFFKEEFPEHTIIDVSDRLDAKNYQMYQIKNMKHKVIMVLERNIINEEVFAQREKRPNDVDMLVLYHGAYRCYDSRGFEGSQSELFRFIKQTV